MAMKYSYKKMLELGIANDSKLLDKAKENLEICKQCREYLGEEELCVVHEKFAIARVKCNKSNVCGKWVQLKGNDCPQKFHSI